MTDSKLREAARAFIADVENGENFDGSLEILRALVEEGTTEHLVTEDAAILADNEDDWRGLYINGKLAAEGHSLPTKQILRLLREAKLNDYETRVVDADWLYELGNLPENISEVKWAPPPLPRRG